MAFALEGVRVIDAGLLIQGPGAASLLAELGADVVKIEIPGYGDQARWVPLSKEDRRSAFFVACNRGKRSVTLDLRRPDGREVLLRLLETADVLITNFTPGTMEGWGLGWDELAVQFPRLIYAAGSAFGPAGPDARTPGADLSAQARGGLLSTVGAAGDDPSPIGAGVADFTGSLHLAAGVLAALVARERIGRGQRVDASLLGSQIVAQSTEFTAYLLSGRVPGRANRSHPLVHGLYGIVPTSDGWLAIVGVPSRDRQTFFDAIGRSDLGQDPRFATSFYAPDVKAELLAVLGDEFAKHPTAHWSEVLWDIGIRSAPVLDYEGVAADPQVWENQFLVNVEHPEWGRLPMVGPPFQLSETPLRPGEIAPELGQHTEEVLLEGGYSWDDIAALAKTGAI